MFQLYQSGMDVKFSFPLPFFIQALNRFDNAHPYLEGQAALLSPPVQVLISSGNTLTNTSRNNV